MLTNLLLFIIEELLNAQKQWQVQYSGRLSRTFSGGTENEGLTKDNVSAALDVGATGLQSWLDAASNRGYLEVVRM